MEVLIREELINSLLLNSINKYHPFIFYTSIILLVTLALFTANWKSKKANFNDDTFIKLSNSSPAIYLILITVTLS